MKNEQADEGREGRTRLARPISLRRGWGQGNVHFPCSADHEQDRQPYPVDVDPYSAESANHTYTSTIDSRYFEGSCLVSRLKLSEVVMLEREGARRTLCVVEL